MKRRTDEPFEFAIGGWIDVQRFKRMLKAREDALARIGQSTVKVEKYVHCSSLKIIDPLRKFCPRILLRSIRATLPTELYVLSVEILLSALNSPLSANQTWSACSP